MTFVKRPMMLYCLSPLHAGAGTEIGSIDNPIQREKHTRFPKVEGSSLKGALRQAFWSSGSAPNAIKKEEIDYIFGPDLTKENGDQAYRSAIQIDDARLLLFPVQSAKGVFAYVTCPWVLEHFFDTLKQSGSPIESSAKPDFEKMVVAPGSKTEPLALVPTNSEISIKDDVVLEDCVYQVKKLDTVAKLAKKIADLLFPIETSPKSRENQKKQNPAAQKIQNSLIILPDQDFRDFVELSTEVITRNKINPSTGTVDSDAGALFTEEYLNQESVLYSMLGCEGIAPAMLKSLKKIDKKREKKGKTLRLRTEFKAEEEIMDFFDEQFSTVLNNRFQLGANATIGKGQMYVRLIPTQS